VLLLAGGDPREVEADLVTVGRQDRSSARAHSSRLLPCALIDTVGASLAIPTRQRTARAIGVEWIDATREPWTPLVREWLVRTGGAQIAS
jgi:hypothetical protein